MRSRVSVAFALMASVLMASALAGTAGASETLSVPSNPIPTATAARPAPGPLSGVLTLPEKAGPSPVLILLHGCGGLGRGVVMQRWVERVNGWGYAAFVLDSFRARGVTSVCPPEDQPKVTAIDRAGDVLNAAMVLAARPDIAGGHIGVIGFSHGGGTAMMVDAPGVREFPSRPDQGGGELLWSVPGTAASWRHADAVAEWRRRYLGRSGAKLCRIRGTASVGPAGGAAHLSRRGARVRQRFDGAGPGDARAPDEIRCSGCGR